MVVCDWLYRQSDLRQIAHDCAILKHNTVLGLGVPLDILEGLGVEAVVDVVGGDVVETHAGFVAPLEGDLMYVEILDFASLFLRV